MYNNNSSKKIYLYPLRTIVKTWQGDESRIKLPIHYYKATKQNYRTLNTKNNST